MSVFDELKKNLAEQRETRFPPEKISFDGTLKDLPQRHKIGGQDLVDYISHLIAQARAFVDKANMPGAGANRSMHGEVRIDCSRLAVSDAFNISSRLLEKAGDLMVTMDFSDSQFQATFIDLEYVVSAGNGDKALHVIFDRACFADRVFFKATATGVDSKQDKRLFSNRITIEASGMEARKELCITGKIGEIVIEKSTIGNLFIRDADLISLDFSATTFDGGVILRTVNVQGDVSFAGAVVKSDATLSDCTFALPPDLHDASFPSETVFLHTHYGSAKKNYKRFEFSDVHINKAPGRFRALRVAMKKAGAQHEEADFFAHELRARRRAAMSPDSAFRMSRTEIGLSKIYDVVSVFGTSISRALLCFLAWNLVFGALFFCADQFLFTERLNVQINSNGDQPFGGQPIVLLVLQNAFNPLALFSSNSTAKVLSSPFFILSMLQSIGSVGIGALVLLAIKVRFQRGSGGGN